MRQPNRPLGSGSVSLRASQRRSYQSSASSPGACFQNSIVRKSSTRSRLPESEAARKGIASAEDALLRARLGAQQAAVERAADQLVHRHLEVLAAQLARRRSALQMELR